MALTMTEHLQMMVDHMGTFIPTDALGSPEERAAAVATSQHWVRCLRDVLMEAEL